jgi:hypothetical protein
MLPRRKTKPTGMAVKDDNSLQEDASWTFASPPFASPAPGAGQAGFCFAY